MSGSLTAGACRAYGPGTLPVVLIHGVGFGPETLDPVLAALGEHAPAAVLTRRGYGARRAEPVAPSVAEHVRDLVALLDNIGARRAVLAGMSGGATVALAPAEIRRLERAEALIEADAAAFASFEPLLPSDPAAAATPLVCSVGEHSSPLRFEVAERLAQRTGAPVVELPGCAHLPQLDAPERFAELILTHALATRTERTLT